MERSVLCPYCGSDAVVYNAEINPMLDEFECLDCDLCFGIECLDISAVEDDDDDDDHQDTWPVNLARESRGNREMLKEICPYCGSRRVVYIGITDGGGDYGDSICDQFECLDCEVFFESGCIDAMDIDDTDE